MTLDEILGVAGKRDRCGTRNGVTKYRSMSDCGGANTTPILT
nr:MAG TPA: hypothetical protein [Caudoviricetes sp.]